MAALLVVEADAVSRHPFNHAVDHHERYGQLSQGADEARVGGKLVGDHDEEAVHASVHEQADELGVALGALGVGDEQGVAVLAAPALEAAGKRREEAALDVGHDESQRVGSLHHEAARNLVGHVALAPRDLLDALLVRRGDLARPVVEYERDGRGRESDLVRDVSERHLARHVRTPSTGLQMELG